MTQKLYECAVCGVVKTKPDPPGKCGACGGGLREVSKPHSELHERVLGQARDVLRGETNGDWRADWAHEWAQALLDLEEQLEAVQRGNRVLVALVRDAEEHFLQIMEPEKDVQDWLARVEVGEAIGALPNSTPTPQDATRVELQEQLETLQRVEKSLREHLKDVEQERDENGRNALDLQEQLEALRETLAELERATTDHANEHGCSGDLGARLYDARRALGSLVVDQAHRDGATTSASRAVSSPASEPKP